MSGLPTLPNTGKAPPKNIAKLVLVALGVTGLALSIYFGVAYARPSKGTEKPVNTAGQTTSTTGTAAPTPAVTTPATTTTSTSSVCTATTTAIFETDAAFDSWKSGQTTWVNSSLAAATPTPDAGVSTVPGLTTRATAIEAAKACLDELYKKAQAASTTQATLQTDLTAKKKTIEERKADIAVARDRAILAAQPDYNRSYYDGWFPLDRPLRQQTTPILIGFALFFLSMSFLTLMSFLRLDVRILIPQLTGTGSMTPLGTQARSPLFLGSVAIIAALTGLTIYAFVRK